MRGLPTIATPLALIFLLLSAPALARPAECLEAVTLEQLVDCVQRHMPRKDSGGFVVPDRMQQADWRSVASSMLRGACEDIALPRSLRGVYAIRELIDGEDGRVYCVLIEIGDAIKNGFVDHGWGTFVVSRSPARELNVLVPHPLFDAGTEVQGVGVFKGTEARSLLIAGTHRRASTVKSPCQAHVTLSDPAHNVDTMFTPTVLELITFYERRDDDYLLLELHGMGKRSCPGVDVYLTYGDRSSQSADDRLLEFRANLLKHHTDWTVTIPGETPPCHLHGTLNVHGRLLNGVAHEEICEIPALRTTGRFIHVEQKDRVRDARRFIGAINDTWPRMVGQSEQ